MILSRRLRITFKPKAKLIIFLQRVRSSMLPTSSYIRSTTLSYLSAYLAECLGHTHYMQFYDLWLHPLQKPNLLCCCSITKKAWFFNSPWRSWTSAAKIPVHCDNAAAIGIANNTIKRQHSRAMEMRYFWVGDNVSQDIYSLSWHPVQENLGNYQSWHHPEAHHSAVRAYYLHKINSPLKLPRAVRDSTLKECVGTLKDGYVCKIPLPGVPQLQSASIGTSKTHSQPT